MANVKFKVKKGDTVKNLDEAAAHGVDGGRRAQGGEGGARPGRQEAEQDQAGGGQDVGEDHEGPVAEAVDERDGGGVGEQLDEEVEGGEDAELGDVDAQAGVEDDEEQRGEVVDDGLDDEAGVGGAPGRGPRAQPAGPGAQGAGRATSVAPPWSPRSATANSNASRRSRPSPVCSSWELHPLPSFL